MRTLRPRAALLLSAAWLLAGCGVAPVERPAEIARFQAELKGRTAALGLEASQPWTLADCERVALENNLEYRVKRLAAQLQDDQVRMAMSGWLPQAQAQWAQTRRNNKPEFSMGGAEAFQMEDQGMRAFSFKALIPIFDFGATYYAWQIAKDRRGQEHLLVVRARQTLLRDARVAYARHASELRQIQLWEAALQAARELVRVAKSYEREGLNGPADTALAEVVLAQGDRELALAKGRARETHLGLGQVLSLPPDAAFAIDPKLPPLPKPLQPGDAARLSASALSRRPELRVQDLQQHVAAQEVRRQLAGFFPHVDGMVNYDWSSLSFAVNPGFVTLGYGVAQSLLDGGSQVWRYNLAKKALPVEQERALLVALGVLYEVELRIIQWAKAQDGVTATDRLAACRETAVKLLQTRYREGLEGSSDLARVLSDYLFVLVDQDHWRTECLVSWYELSCAALQDDAPAVSSAAGVSDTVVPPLQPRSAEEYKLTQGTEKP